MAKFNVLFHSLVNKINELWSHWVTKVALFALGVWCFPLQPYAYSTEGSPRSD